MQGHINEVLNTLPIITEVITIYLSTMMEIVLAGRSYIYFTAVPQFQQNKKRNRYQAQRTLCSRKFFLYLNE